jgi:microcystin-dependent protein
LIIPEMPAHTHVAQGVTTQATLESATGATWAMSSLNPYGTTPNTSLAPGALGTAGGSQPHNNMPPYLTLNFCIALQGIFPSRN